MGGNLIKADESLYTGLNSVLSAVKTHFDKKSRQKWMKILLAVWFFLFFSVFSAYLNYSYCSDADFPSPKPRFETLDQDYLLADELNKFEISKPTLLPTIVESLLPRKLLSFFQESCCELEAVILRC